MNSSYLSKSHVRNIKKESIVEMVKLIIEQDGLETITTFLKKAFDYNDTKWNGFHRMYTQFLISGRKNEHLIHSSWTVKIADQKLFIISDHISSVIDLTEEIPYEIKTEGFKYYD